MKRTALWLLSTVTVVVLLFGYHTSTSGVTGASAPTAIYSGSVPTGSSSGTPTTTPSSTPSSAPGSTTPKSKRSATPSATPSVTSRTVTGTTASTQWGPVQVELTVEGTQITAVDVVQYPNGNGRDGEINSYALPVLIKETLAAQSAQIDMVSGATVTSGGYLTSLQSALDQIA